MVQAVQQGLRDLAPLWEQVLSAETWGELQTLADQTEANISFPDRLWARTVYDFACADHQRRFNRDQLLQLAKDLGDEVGEIDKIDSMNLDVWVTKDNIPVKLDMSVKGESEGAKMDIQIGFNVTNLNDPSIKIQKPI